MSTQSPPTQTSPLVTFAPAILLAVVLGTLAGLNAAGLIHFGRRAATPTVDAKPTDDEKVGRYQVEMVEDGSLLLDRAGNLGFFGEATQEVWVYRYSGGLLECNIEAETYGGKAAGQTLPESWKGLLDGNPELQKKVDGELRKAGYVIVAALRPVMPVNEALAPYSPHLGGLFVNGPAGILHQLTTLHMDSSHWRVYKIMLSTGPVKGQKGAGFNLWTGQALNVRLPLVSIDPRDEEFRVGGGKDLTPDEELTLMERRRGATTVRLKARFLSDGKADEVFGVGK